MEHVFSELLVCLPYINFSLFRFSMHLLKKDRVTLKHVSLLKNLVVLLYPRYNGTLVMQLPLRLAILMGGLIIGVFEVMYSLFQCVLAILGQGL